MDKAPAVGRRSHFLITGSSTPQLIVGNGPRHALVIVNESSTMPIHIGFSGTAATRGMFIGAGLSFADNYTQDDWWLVGSGTLVSGFVVT